MIYVIDVEVSEIKKGSVLKTSHFKLIIENENII